MSVRIDRNLAIDIRHDFVARMRSIGKAPKEIAQLNIFLEASLTNINDLAKVT